MGLRKEKRKKSDIMLLLCGMGELVEQKNGGLDTGKKTGALFSTSALDDVYSPPLIPICSRTIVH